MPPSVCKADINKLSQHVKIPGHSDLKRFYIIDDAFTIGIFARATIMK